MSEQLRWINEQPRVEAPREVPGGGTLTLVSEAASAIETPMWRLDEATRQIGRDGIAAARAALQATSPRYDLHQQAA